MKNILKKIGNFFKKIGLFIAKCAKVAWNYLKENVWLQPIVIVVLILGATFGIKEISTAIENHKANVKETETKKDKLVTVTMAEVEEKINNKEDFILFIGSHNCYHCQDFKPIISRYIESSGTTVYYIDIESETDTSFNNKTFIEWQEKLADIDTRDFTTESFSTPTVVIVRSGEFKDAKSGAQGLEGGMDYLKLVDFLEGKYIGKVEA